MCMCVQHPETDVNILYSRQLDQVVLHPRLRFDQVQHVQYFPFLSSAVYRQVFWIMICSCCKRKEVLQRFCQIKVYLQSMEIFYYISIVGLYTIQLQLSDCANKVQIQYISILQLKQVKLVESRRNYNVNTDKPGQSEKSGPY